MKKSLLKLISIGTLAVLVLRGLEWLAIKDYIPWYFPLIFTLIALVEIIKELCG